MKVVYRKIAFLTRSTLREKEPTRIEVQVKKQRVAKSVIGGQCFFLGVAREGRNLFYSAREQRNLFNFGGFVVWFGKDELISFFSLPC